MLILNLLTKFLTPHISILFGEAIIAGAGIISGPEIMYGPGIMSDPAGIMSTIVPGSFSGLCIIGLTSMTLLLE